VNGAIYVYDVRTQMTRPVFVVYDSNHVRTVATALFGCYPSFLCESRVRLHNVGPADPYSTAKNRR
jgi:hypothetical protein